MTGQYRWCCLNTSFVLHEILTSFTVVLLFILYKKKMYMIY